MYADRTFRTPHLPSFVEVPPSQATVRYCITPAPQQTKAQPPTPPRSLPARPPSSPGPSSEAASAPWRSPCSPTACSSRSRRRTPTGSSPARTRRRFRTGTSRPRTSASSPPRYRRRPRRLLRGLRRSRRSIRWSSSRAPGTTSCCSRGPSGSSRPRRSLRTRRSPSGSTWTWGLPSLSMPCWCRSSGGRAGRRRRLYLCSRLRWRCSYCRRSWSVSWCW